MTLLYHKQYLTHVVEPHTWCTSLRHLCTNCTEWKQIWQVVSVRPPARIIRQHLSNWTDFDIKSVIEVCVCARERACVLASTPAVCKQ